MQMPDLPIPPKKKGLQQGPTQAAGRRYGFDRNGTMYLIGKYRPGQWERLKAKLGEVIEIRAKNRKEALTKYQAEIKRKGAGQASAAQ